MALLSHTELTMGISLLSPQAVPLGIAGRLATWGHLLFPQQQTNPSPGYFLARATNEKKTQLGQRKSRTCCEHDQLTGSRANEQRAGMCFECKKPNIGMLCPAGPRSHSIIHNTSSIGLATFTLTAAF